MSNPYVPPTFSAYNFNANPPSDDGSQTIANTVSWNGNNGTAGVLSKIGSPLSNYAQAVSSAANSAFGTLANQIDTTFGVFEVIANTVPAMGVTIQAGEIFGGGVLLSIAQQSMGAGSSYTGTSVSGASVSGTISGITSMAGLGVGLTISGTNISGNATIFSLNVSGSSITINKAITISGTTTFSTLIPTPSVNPRLDLVSLSQSTGLTQYTQGTEAVTPTQPAIPGGYTPLATLSLTSLTTIITSSNITDQRVFFPQGAAIAVTGTVSTNNVAAFADNTGTLLKALAIISPQILFQRFTVSGTSTYTPTTNLQNCIVFCTGPGGNGAAAGSLGGGGGGGGGGTSFAAFPASTVSGPITVTVGSVGISSTFGALLTGNFGANASAGGAVSGGAGGTGGASVSGTGIFPLAGGDGDTGGTGDGTDANGGAGGTGGSSFWGGGGRGGPGVASPGTGTAGAAAATFGAGGGGGGGPNGTAGAGKNGCVLVIEFIGGNTS